MISLFQNIFAFVFSPFSKLTSKFSDLFNNSIVFLCTLLISAYYFIGFERFTVPFFEAGPTRVQLICGVIMFVLIVFSVKGELKPIRWNRLLFYLMYFAGLGMLVVSFLHRVGGGYRVFSLFLMIGFPALYFVWNNRADYNTLFQMFSVSYIISGLIVYLHFLLLSFNGQVEVPGGRVTPNMNTNLFGMLGMIMIVSATYLLFLKCSEIKWILLSTFSIGMGMNIIMLSQSRSCLLVVVGDVICALVFYFKLIKVDKKCFQSRTLLLLLICLVFFVTAFHFVGSYALSINENKLKIPAESVVDTDITDRLNITDNSAESFSSGRIIVWRWYCSHLNWGGNDVYSVSLEEDTGRIEVGAHNTILDYGFRFGIPVASIHLLLEIIVGCMSLWVLFSKRFTDTVYLFIALGVMTYAVQSMIELALLPFDRHAVLLYYLSIMPLLTLHFSDNSSKHSN